MRVYPTGCPVNNVVFHIVSALHTNEFIHSYALRLLNPSATYCVFRPTQPTNLSGTGNEK